MLEDSKIIELFFTRVEQAIVELSAKYGIVCRRIARNILKNDFDAEECVNDTYLAAWNTIPPPQKKKIPIRCEPTFSALSEISLLRDTMPILLLSVTAFMM